MADRQVTVELILRHLLVNPKVETFQNFLLLLFLIQFILPKTNFILALILIVDDQSVADPLGLSRSQGHHDLGGAKVVGLAKVELVWLEMKII